MPAAASKGPGPAAAKSEIPSFPAMDLSSLFGLQGKVALITGGGSGLGSMMAKAFVENGATVYISSRKVSNLQGTADALNAIRPNSCHCLASDVSSKAGCDALAKDFMAHSDRLDILVNNSGLSWGSSMLDVHEQKGWDKVFAVNVKALFYLTVALLPLLQKNKTDQDPGRVINISSIYSFFPNPYQPTVPNGGGTFSYGPSKAAVSALTRSMAAELMPKHVTVNAILPGYVSTPMTRTGSADLLAKMHPSGRMSGPVDMAGITLLYAGKAGAHITGTLMAIDGGMSLYKAERWGKEAAESFKPKKGPDGESKL